VQREAEERSWKVTSCEQEVNSNEQTAYGGK